MSENQKNDSKKSFLQRNLFLIVIFLIIITIAGGYLYRNNLLIFDETQISKLNQETQSPNVQKETTSVNNLNNKELEDKVDRLESLILELAKNVQEIPQTTVVEPEPQQITLSNDEAYELILSINQIIINIEQQQIRNKNIQKLQNQYLFFNEEKLKVTLQSQLFSGIPGKLKKQKRRAAQFGAGCTNFQLEIFFLDPFREGFPVLSFFLDDVVLALIILPDYSHRRAFLCLAQIPK